MPAQPPTNPPPGPYGHRPQPPQHGGSGQPPQYGGGQQPQYQSGSGQPQHQSGAPQTSPYGGGQPPQYGGGQQPPYPGGPQPSPFGAPPPPPKKKNTGLIIGLVGGGLVLVLIIIGALGLGLFGFFAFKKDPVAEPAPGTSSPDSKPAPLPENTGDPNDPGSQDDGDAPPPGSDIATSLGKLKAGDCVINLSTAGPPATVPCSEPHVHQIFSVGRTSDQSDTYPGYSALSKDGESYCKSARFELDTDRAVADDLKMVFFTPNATGWKDPDNRHIVCAVQRKDGSKMSEDYSKTA